MLPLQRIELNCLTLQSVATQFNCPFRIMLPLIQFKKGFECLFSSCFQDMVWTTGCVGSSLNVVGDRAKKKRGLTFSTRAYLLMHWGCICIDPSVDSRSKAQMEFEQYYLHEDMCGTLCAK